MGQVEKAVELFKDIVAIREKVLTEDHPFRLGSQHALAKAYCANKQVEAAVKLVEYVISIQ